MPGTPPDLLAQLMSHFVRRCADSELVRGSFRLHPTVEMPTLVFERFGTVVPQACFALQIPFFMVGMMYVSLISSLKANQILMYGAALNGVMNVVLNYLFMKWLGVAGIALSTTLVYVLWCSYLMFMSRRLMQR